jgi:hypothetical protein
MFDLWIFPKSSGPIRSLAFVAGCVLALATISFSRSVAAEDAQDAIMKANTIIEAAKTTERAVESWERYASWVNMKTGPTGKERYISYGMYDLYDVPGVLADARKAAGAAPPAVPLDNIVPRYLDTYEALAPVMNAASAYYERNGYEADNAAQGRALHKKMVPLATAFLAERDALMPELRRYVREVEGQELAAIEARDGRGAAWQAGQVLHAANSVMDLFPRDRPQQITGDELDEMMKGLGPDTPGEKFDEIIMGVKKPKDATIDVARFREALDAYAASVATFDGFTGEKPEEFDELKPLPRQLLDLLRAFEQPLVDSKGREFDGGGQMVAQIVERYFALFNAGNGIAQSRLRYLP